MNAQSAKNNSDSSLKLGIRFRPKPTHMRQKIRRLLRSFLPVSQLRNNHHKRTNN